MCAAVVEARTHAHDGRIRAYCRELRVAVVEASGGAVFEKRGAGHAVSGRHAARQLESAYRRRRWG